MHTADCRMSLILTCQWGAISNLLTCEKHCLPFAETSLPPLLETLPFTSLKEKQFFTEIRTVIATYNIAPVGKG